ncbi:dienelactone hydrolase family protein [Amycolatopsis jejuensis]|uniref:dienelactone hydrolase family protein n=1 Tax=Amycolatopsis jejuensis TaxID=330084 RepID=UPI000A91AEDF|nr:dienelactone hydrolase family protein [Amycolatopsis jejuensis]
MGEVLGFCLGGTLALDLAATGSDVATACYYPFPRGFGNPSVTKAPRPVDLAEAIRSPVLCHWGDDHPYTAYVHPGAGHGFLAGLSEQNADSKPARESWARTDANLGQAR